MHKVAGHGIADDITLIKVSNVPAILLEGDAIKVIEDSRLKRELIIEVDESLKPYGMSFTIKPVGSTLFVYWDRNKNSNLKALSDLSFTMRVPEGRQTDVEIV